MRIYANESGLGAMNGHDRWTVVCELGARCPAVGRSTIMAQHLTTALPLHVDGEGSRGQGETGQMGSTSPSRSVRPIIAVQMRVVFSLDSIKKK